MPEHPIEGLMKTTMTSLKEMVDVNTIVGDPVQSADGLVIIPISRICLGFASGGTEFNTANKKSRRDDSEEQAEKLPFGGGSGAGVSVQPVAFIVVGNNQMKLLPVDQNSNALNNLFELADKVVNNVQDFIGNKKNNSNKQPNQANMNINADNNNDQIM